jgi:hypothetical protein
MFLPL